jgi:hypothetical protein
MTSILERLRPERRTPAADLTRALSDTRVAIARQAGDARDAIATGVDETAGLVGKAVDLAGERLQTFAEDAGRTGHELGREGSHAWSDLRRAVGRVGHEVDATLREAKAAVTAGRPLDDMVVELERRWPGTDKGRYDRAFERGYARGRSGRLAIGVIVGAAIGAAAAYLFDPERGVARREALVQRIRRLGDDLRRTIDEQREAMARRQAEAPRAWSSAGTGVAVGPGPASTDTAPPDAPAMPDTRIPVGAGTMATEDQAAERGDWHRDLPAD